MIIINYNYQSIIKVASVLYQLPKNAISYIDNNVENFLNRIIVFLIFFCLPNVYNSTLQDVFSTFSSDSGNVHDFPEGSEHRHHLPKSKSMPDYSDAYSAMPGQCEENILNYLITFCLSLTY